jgi:hypothetical protein
MASVNLTTSFMGIDPHNLTMPIDELAQLSYELAAESYEIAAASYELAAEKRAALLNSLSIHASSTIQDTRPQQDFYRTSYSKSTT